MGGLALIEGEQMAHYLRTDVVASVLTFLLLATLRYPWGRMIPARSLSRSGVANRGFHAKILAVPVPDTSRCHFVLHTPIA